MINIRATHYGELSCLVSRPNENERICFVSGFVSYFNKYVEYVLG